MIDGVICFPQVNKAYVQGAMEFPCLLHQCANRKQVVCTTPSTAKTTLVLTQEEFCSGFHTIQDGFCEDLAGGTEEVNPTIIITDGTAAFLVKWN